MQRFTTTSYYNDEDMIFVPSSLGGVIDFDKFDAFENMLREIIVIPEYWRMQRIQQLGFVEHAMPSAHHTRFEHCIGTFDLMRNLIYWSNRNYKKSRSEALRFNEKEQAAQAAALLHDIGHAFPGHPFERAIKTIFPETYKDHEKWSLEIIQRSKISNILNSYSVGFADKVLKIMAEDDLDNNIWQQVHCGNLNVDTLDYLHRDQSRTSSKSDLQIARRIIENVKFGKNSDNQDCVILCPGAEVDFIKMLAIRGKMYSDVYFSGMPAAAEAFLLGLFQGVARALDTQKHKSAMMASGNPFIKFIDSRGTDYSAYINLTGDAFYSMIDTLCNMKVAGLSDIAAKYQNISLNFFAEDVFKGYASDAPCEKEIQSAKTETENRGGILKDVTVPLYSVNKSDVYIMPLTSAGSHKFSDTYSEFANRKVRIISKLFMSDKTR